MALGDRNWCVTTALCSADQGQGSGQLALGDGSVKQHYCIPGRLVGREVAMLLDSMDFACGLKSSSSSESPINRKPPF